MVRGGSCSKGVIPSLPLGMVLTSSAVPAGRGQFGDAHDGAEHALQPHSLGQDGDLISGLSSARH